MEIGIICIYYERLGPGWDQLPPVILGVNIYVCQLIFLLTLIGNMPVSDEGEGDDRDCGGDGFVKLQRKPRNKVCKRSMTNSPYQIRSHYKNSLFRANHVKCSHKKVTIAYSFLNSM